jgi:hypothetical protein
MDEWIEKICPRCTAVRKKEIMSFAVNG